MPVILRQSIDLHTAGGMDYWCAVTGTASSLPKDALVPDIAQRLEAAFDGIRDIWWDIGRELGALPTSDIAHTPTCAPYVCDLGQMMAWTVLVQDLTKAPERMLVLCDDPWVYRQLANIPGVEAAKPPVLLPWLLRGIGRGYLARARFVMRAVSSAIKLAKTRKAHGTGETVLLAYGHPLSRADGHDAYFGDLMPENPGLKRLLHTDCGPVFAKRLAADGRSASLHAWGDWTGAWKLVFETWKVPTEALQSPLTAPWEWLLKRAIFRENATAAPATNRWQITAQRRWLADRKPHLVCWPFENHPWERSFSRDARAMGVATVGYQHTVIGPHQFNPSPRSNPDGLASYPDKVLYSSPLYMDQMGDWGVPDDRRLLGGAFRFQPMEHDLYDPDGPVFVALSAIKGVTLQMMEAVQRARRPGRIFYIKSHPLYPMPVEEDDDIRRVTQPFVTQPRACALFYGTGASGLEGLFAGVPTFRLLSHSRVVVNVLPPGIDAIPVSVEGLRAALDHAEKPEPLPFEAVYAPVDRDLWKATLGLS